MVVNMIFFWLWAEFIQTEWRECNWRIIRTYTYTVFIRYFRQLLRNTLVALHRTRKQKYLDVNKWTNSSALTHVPMVTNMAKIQYMQYDFVLQTDVNILFFHNSSDVYTCHGLKHFFLYHCWFWLLQAVQYTQEHMENL